MIETPRITLQLATAAEKSAVETADAEVCGIWFFPHDPLLAGFLQLPNGHAEPKDHFKIEYDDIEYGLGEKYGGDFLPGQITIFHSHPFRVGLPSRDDLQAIEDFAKHMDGHPFWTPTERHMIFSLWDHSWWWFDLNSFGRVGWRWPEE
jgi:proteasome lid subunit RPN8/RPN11